MRFIEKTLCLSWAKARVCSFMQETFTLYIMEEIEGGIKA
jgi:hypothetical protein